MNGDPRVAQEVGGGCRIGVEHVTTYRYSEPVTQSFNEARLTPRGDGGQRVERAQVRTDPPTRLRSWSDYWGNSVTAFEIDEPHTELRVTGSSTVEVAGAAGPGPEPAGWDVVRGEDALDSHAELLAATPMTAADDRLAALGDRVGRAADPVAAVRAGVAAVRDLLDYRPGRTGVATCAAEAAATGAGVCQDFAHVSLAVLRRAGVPARYCSGYLLPGNDVGPGSRGAGQSHAWIEVWTGRWWGTDPTNQLDVGPHHVVVARGRDYADVAPLRGVYCGDGSQTMSVTVTMTRLPG